MKRVLVAISLSVAVVFVAAVVFGNILIATGRAPAPAPTAAQLPTATSAIGASAESTEYKLAVIQRSGYVASDDPLVGQLGQALDALATRCDESRGALADYSVSGVDILHKQGLADETPLGLLRHWRESLPNENVALHCDEVLAAYIATRTR